MIEFLLGILFMCAAWFGESLFELAVAALVDLVLRGVAGVFEALRFANPVFSSLVYTVLGASAGGLTLFIFPHPLVRPSRFHGISVLVSPIVTGLATSLIGYNLSRLGRKVTQIDSFGYGYAFALGDTFSRSDSAILFSVINSCLQRRARELKISR